MNSFDRQFNTVQTIITIGFVLTFGFIVASPFINYYQMGVQAKIINQKYGTSYTAMDMMMAGDTIKQNVVGNQNNVNLNVKGNN